MWAHRDMKIQIPHCLGLTRLFSRPGALPTPCAPLGFPPRGVSVAQGQAAASLAACPLGRGFEPESAWGVSTKKAHRNGALFCASL